MVQVDAKYDGKVLILEEPLDVAPGTVVRVMVVAAKRADSEQADASTTQNGWYLGDAMAADPNFDEREYLDRMEREHPTPPDLVRKPGSAKGEFVVPDDFDEIPEEFEDYI